MQACFPAAAWGTGTGLQVLGRGDGALGGQQHEGLSDSFNLHVRDVCPLEQRRLPVFLQSATGCGQTRLNAGPISQLF